MEKGARIGEAILNRRRWLKKHSGIGNPWDATESNWFRFFRLTGGIDRILKNRILPNFQILLGYNGNGIAITRRLIRGWRVFYDSQAMEFDPRFRDKAIK